MMNKIYVVSCETYSPCDPESYHVFTTPEDAEACRVRLIAEWGEDGCSPNYEVEEHDV